MPLPSGELMLTNQQDIECQHKQILNLFPQAVWKFYTTECAKWSDLEDIILSKKWNPVKKYTDLEVWYPNTIWSFIYMYSDISNDAVYKRYLDMHVSEVPSRALWFTPNWRRFEFHKKWKRERLELKKDSWVKWMYCVPLDVDKKDYDKAGIPLPEEFKMYESWTRVDPLEFIHWWFDNTRNIEPDWIEYLDKSFYKQIVNNISRVNITPWWFHAYMMIHPKELEDEFFREMTAEDYKMYMEWFHRLAWDLMFDSSRTNINDVMRLPWTLHRKYKTRKWDIANEFVCIWCNVQDVNYEESSDHVVTLWQPFVIWGEWMRYAQKWRVKEAFKSIKKWLEDPEFVKKISWYDNQLNTTSFAKTMTYQQLSVSEQEIWRACNELWLNRWTVIDNLPWHNVQFDRTPWALNAKDKNWNLIKTSWYKFKKLNLMTSDAIKSYKWKTYIDDNWCISNYCGWYVNDWFSKHWRPAWPMLSFVYQYMKIYVCPEWTQNLDIYNEVRKYFKEICPEIDEDKLWNRLPISREWIRRVWTPRNYIELADDWVYCVYTRQAANGRDVPMEKWMTVFERPIEVIWKLIINLEWPKFISNSEITEFSKYDISDWGRYTKDISDTVEKYLIKVNDTIVSLSSCVTANQMESQLQRINSWLHFVWKDELVKRFFSALDMACDENLDTHDEYWMDIIYWNQWSKYWINKKSWLPYCVIWDDWVYWDVPEILEAVDESSKSIIDKNLAQVSMKEYRKKIWELWDAKTYQKIFISAWSCQFMNIAEEVMNANLWITLWPNLNVYWWSETWKSSLRYAIQSSLWYKNSKRYLSMQMVTPQPLIDSMCDWSAMIFEEMTSKWETEQKKQESKETIIRGSANKEIKSTWWLNSKRLVKMRSCNIYFGESAIKDDSANNRIIKVKLTKACRNPNKEAWEEALKRLQNHSVSNVLYEAIWKYYEESKKKDMFYKLAEYKRYISKAVNNERVWDIECYWMFLYVNIFKFWTKEKFLEMIEYNKDEDISYTKDLSKVDPETAFSDLLSWIISRADKERTPVSYWFFHEFPDSKYNSCSDDDRVYFIKIQASDSSTNIANYDNDVEKLAEIMPGFVKTINWMVYICVYNLSIIEHIKELHDDEMIDIDFDKFESLNSKICVDVENQLFWKTRFNWISFNKAAWSNSKMYCDKDIWKIIRKVILSWWIQL